MSQAHSSKPTSNAPHYLGAPSFVDANFGFEVVMVSPELSIPTPAPAPAPAAAPAPASTPLNPFESKLAEANHLIGLSHFEHAESILKEAADEATEDPRPHEMLSKLYKQKGDAPYAVLHEAESLARRHQWQKVKDLHQAAVNAYPTFLPIHEMMLRVNFDNNSIFDSGESPCQATVIHFPNELIGYLGLAKYYLMSGEMEKATQTLRTAKKKSRSYSPELRSLQKAAEQQQSLLHQAETALEASRLDEAEAAFEKGISIQPPNLRFYDGLVSIARQRNDYDAMIKWLEEAIERCTVRRQENYKKLLAFLINQGRITEAKSHCQKIIDLPGHATFNSDSFPRYIYDILIDVTLHENDHQTSLQLWREREQKLQSSNGCALHLLASPKNYINLMECLIENGTREEADQFINETWRKYPSDSSLGEDLSISHLHIITLCVVESILTLVAEHLSQQGATLVIASQSSLRNETIPSKWSMLNLDTTDDVEKWVDENPEYIKLLWDGLDYDYTKEDLISICTDTGDQITRRGRLNNDDHRSMYLTVQGGYRLTTDTPQCYRNSIYLIGDSKVKGFGAEDKHTIPSFLQKALQDHPETRDQYAVFNMGVDSQSIIESAYKILTMKFQEGDVVILAGNPLAITTRLQPTLGKHIPTIACDVSKRDDNEPLFLLRNHLNYRGNKIVADHIYEELFAKETGCLYEKRPPKPDLIPLCTQLESNNPGAFDYVKKMLGWLDKSFSNKANEIHDDPELATYLAELRELKLKDGTVGSIVMNCNPFTYGHRYLIEYAASKVDNLIVFVVEEDRSVFKFNDRLRLICEGTKDLDNVHVIRSGKFIISSNTFPEYFDKEASPTTVFDASTDLDFFGESIAPELNITARFVGEEPYCPITNQYNKQMRHVLPLYGIKVEEVPRKAVADKAISATSVRKCLQENDLETLRILVPPTTFDFLMAMDKNG